MTPAAISLLLVHLKKRRGIGGSAIHGGAAAGAAKSAGDAAADRAA